MPNGKRHYQEKPCLECGENYVPVAARQKWCSKCAPEVSQRERRRSRTTWQRRNPEKTRVENATYKRVNSKKVKADFASWKKANPVRVRELKLRWAAENPEKNRAMGKRHNSKRRALGWNTLNSWFVGCDGHHINLSDVIYIPKAMHGSVSHDIWTGRGMKEINVLAGQYLTEDWT